MAAYTFGKKKTVPGISNAMAALIGAANMNNTMTLGVFLMLIYAKDLLWKFSAETVGILACEWIIGGLALKSDVHTWRDAFVVFSCYP